MTMLLTSRMRCRLAERRSGAIGIRSVAQSVGSEAVRRGRRGDERADLRAHLVERGRRRQRLADDHLDLFHIMFGQLDEAGLLSGEIAAPQAAKPDRHDRDRIALQYLEEALEEGRDLAVERQTALGEDAEQLAALEKRRDMVEGLRVDGRILLPGGDRKGAHRRDEPFDG